MVRTIRDATVELELRFDSLVFDSLLASLAAADLPTVECWGCGVALQVEDAFEDSGGHWVGECCDVPPHARLAPPQGIVFHATEGPLPPGSYHAVVARDGSLADVRAT